MIFRIYSIKPHRNITLYPRNSILRRSKTFFSTTFVILISNSVFFCLFDWNIALLLNDRLWKRMFCFLWNGLAISDFGVWFVCKLLQISGIFITLLVGDRMFALRFSVRSRAVPARLLSTSSKAFVVDKKFSEAFAKGEVLLSLTVRCFLHCLSWLLRFRMGSRLEFSRPKTSVSALQWKLQNEQPNHHKTDGSFVWCVARKSKRCELLVGGAEENAKPPIRADQRLHWRQLGCDSLQEHWLRCDFHVSLGPLTVFVLGSLAAECLVFDENGLVNEGIAHYL